jgi:hypothetical protein
MAIAFDVAGGNFSTGTTSLTFNLTVANQPNRLLVLWVFGVGASPTSVDFNGDALTSWNNHSFSSHFRVYYLYAPDVGTSTLTINFSGSTHVYAVASVYNGVKQSSFPDASNRTSANTGTSLTGSVTTTVDNCWVIGGSYVLGATTYTDNDPTSGDTRRAQQDNGGGSSKYGIACFDKNAATSPAGGSNIGYNTATTSDIYAITFSIAPSSPVINASETALASDAISRSLSRELNETALSSDTVSRSLSRFFAENVVGVDTVVASRTRRIVTSETFLVSDNVDARGLWSRRTKPSTSWSDRSSPATSWTDRTPPTTSWTDRTPPS